MIHLKYNVQIKKADLSKINKRMIQNIEIDDENIQFKTNTKSLQLLLNDISDIKYNNIRKQKKIAFLKKYFISIIALLILFLLLINNMLIVKKVKFVKENTYNQEVVDYINDNCFKIGFFKYLKWDLNTLNDDIKSKFYYYEWINLEKKGNCLNIIIDKQDEKSYLNSESTIKGDIVAKSQGIVRYYFVKKGVCLVKDNQSINSGDILITGNLQYYNNKSEYIHPVAIVLAETVNKENIKIKKQEITFKRTGKIKIDYFYHFENNNLQYKDYFPMYECIDEVVFNYNNIKKIKRIYYEVEEVLNYYTADNAYLYALSLIKKQFNEHKIHTKEKIVSINLLYENEDEEYYYYTFIIKNIVNVAEFKALMLEENEK